MYFADTGMIIGELAIALLIAAAVYGAALLMGRDGRASTGVHALRYCFMAYMLFLLMLTLMPVGDGGGGANLVPLAGLREMLAEGSRGERIVAALNIAAFIPMGAMLPSIMQNARFSLTLALCFLTTLTIELLQLATASGRVFDVDDIILNTLGGCAGYVLSLPLRRGRLRTRAL